ncbi:hypothetical protein PFTANZ_06654, partial [Plasmodium falciparum Tanzania (2000708)]
MFYTFADYKHICLGKDIGNDLVTVKKNITAVFQNGAQNPSDQDTDSQRQVFWGTYGKDIWEGMLCALEKAGAKKSLLTEKYNYSNVTFTDDHRGSKLIEFASRPSFLRWMTEWGDQLCRERITLLHILNGECQQCTLSTDGSCKKNDQGCTQCTAACTIYHGWITKWQEQYNKQNDKFKTDKENIEYMKDEDLKESKEAYEYLGKKLKNITCTSGSNIVYCNCMEETLSTNASSEKMPASLDYPPTEIEGKCDCKPPPKKPEDAPPVPSRPQPSPRSKPKPKPKPPQPYLPPALKNAMLSSTIMWSIGIGFATFTYFYLK